MAGPLNSIFAAMNLAILGNLPPTIVPTFGMSGFDRVAESAPPRIVWVPTSEDIQPARGQGGDVVVDSVKNMNLPPGAQPPLYTRVCNVECDAWGASRDDVETMINAVVSAAHDTLSQGGYGIVAARWLLPEEAGKDGEVYRLTFQFLVPIVRVQPGTTIANINSMPQTPKVNPLVGS